MYCRYITTLKSSQKVQEKQDGWIVSFYDPLQFWVRIFTNTRYRPSYLVFRTDGYICSWSHYGPAHGRVRRAGRNTLMEKMTTLETRIYRKGKTLWLNGGTAPLIPNLETEWNSVVGYLPQPVVLIDCEPLCTPESEWKLWREKNLWPLLGISVAWSLNPQPGHFAGNIKVNFEKKMLFWNYKYLPMWRVTCRAFVNMLVIFGGLSWPVRICNIKFSINILYYGVTWRVYWVTFGYSHIFIYLL